LRLAEQKAREPATPQGRARGAAYMVHTLGDIKKAGQRHAMHICILFFKTQFTRLNITCFYGQNKNERRGEVRYFTQRFS